MHITIGEIRVSIVVYGETWFTNYVVSMSIEFVYSGIA